MYVIKSNWQFWKAKLENEIVEDWGIQTTFS